MLLSVIIPTYNRAHTLARALDSVLCQKLSHMPDQLEIIVVDDGSDDETQVLLKTRYSQITVISQRNHGVSRARNVGIQHAAGEWIALLDSDDEWLPDKLEKQMALLSQTGLLVCHSEEIWVRNGVRVNQMNKHQKRGGWIYPSCLPLCAMSPSSIVIHRSVFKHVGLFDETLPACEDYDLWLRISSHYEVAYVEQALIKKYGGHDDQLSRQHWGMDRFRVRALQKRLHSGDLREDYANATQAMLIRKNRILLKGAIKHDNQALIAECQAIEQQFSSSQGASHQAAFEQ